MEEKSLAIQPQLANYLATLVYDHQLPVNITVGKSIDHLRQLTLSYHMRDELLIEWLMSRIDEESIYA